MAIENEAARGADRDRALPVVLRLPGVFVATEDLVDPVDPEQEREEGEHACSEPVDPEEKGSAVLAGARGHLASRTMPASVAAAAARASFQG